MIVAYASDVTKHRFIFTLIPTCIGITGFGILLKVHHNRDLEYAALFLVAMGIYSAMPVTVCWFQMNVVGHHRKGERTLCSPLQPLFDANFSPLSRCRQCVASGLWQHWRNHRSTKPISLCLLTFPPN